MRGYCPTVQNYPAPRIKYAKALSMSMQKAISLFLLAVLLLFAFGCTQTTAVQGFELASAFTVKENSFYYNSFEDINIAVISFTDSRCPKNVQCIWAGEQGINLLVSASGQDTNIYLGETTAKSRQFSSLGKSYEVSLVSIDVGKKEAQIELIKASGS